MVLDFAEKVLLSRLVKETGKIYLVTGLKFDIFGVHDRNKRSCYVFGLPEGHWMNEKLLMQLSQCYTTLLTVRSL